jgi:hypothetical protein
MSETNASGPEMRSARNEGMKNLECEPYSDPFVGLNGKPLVRISCAAAELIPTVQYGNCGVGPVGVIRYIEDNGVDGIKQGIKETQELCEEAIAEDRKTVHAMTRQSEQGRYKS